MENPVVTSAPESDVATGDVAVDSTTGGSPEAARRQDTSVIEAELLVEEISIDGMCGVY